MMNLHSSDTRREVCKCDGWVCDFDMMGAPSKLSVIRKAAALARARPTLLLSWAEKAVFVYYESMKWKLKINPIYECRCNGRLQTKRFMRLAHTGLVVEQEHLDTDSSEDRWDAWFEHGRKSRAAKVEECSHTWLYKWYCTRWIVVVVSIIIIKFLFYY